jgi:uncharacterized SAM-binding protein YcdF (DUF218 family)
MGPAPRHLVPPSTLRSGGSVRRVLLIAAVVIAAGSAWAVYHLGAFLYDEQPLQRADTIFVFAGTRMERALEAADLYRQGYARLVVLTEEMSDGAIDELARHGIIVPTDAEVARDVMIRLGMPPDAIVIAPGVHNSTGQEAQTLRSLARVRGWRRVIVVTSKFHTRRAGLAARREVGGMGVEVIARGSRYDAADPAHWWRTRSDVRWVLLETEKIIAYWLRLGM